MIVFISWSGARSHAVAESLRTWLNDVIYAVRSWVSSEDICSGARWGIDIARRLEEADFGILCLTKDNLNEPWLLFEAGALAKTMDRALVCPYLLDLKPSELQGPLLQFQAARADESGTRIILHSINEKLGENARPTEQVDRAFRRWWPELDAALRASLQAVTQDAEIRPDRELLEEILDQVRGIRFLGIQVPSAKTLADVISDRSGLFYGADIERLISKLHELGGDNDPNAAEWGSPELIEVPADLDGLSNSRWGGGTAFGSLGDWNRQSPDTQELCLHHASRSKGRLLYCSPEAG